MDPDAFVERLGVLIERHLAGFEERYGYPPGENRVTPATSQDGRDLLIAEFGDAVPPDILEFFTTIGELSLPDFWNGYFIGPPAWVVSLHRERAPLAVEDSPEVLVFGSDGGGTLYAVPIPAGQPVLALPPGEITRGRYTGEPKVIAQDFPDFCAILLREVGRAAQELGTASP